MNKLTIPPVAAVVMLSLSGYASANDYDVIEYDKAVKINADFQVDMGFKEYLKVKGFAVVENKQSFTDNTTTYDIYNYKGSSNNTSLGNDAIGNNSGNVGLNMAAGSGNVQANNVALAVQEQVGGDNWGAYYGKDKKGGSKDVSKPTVDAEIFSDQYVGGNKTTVKGSSNTTYLGDNSIKNNSGNVGVNVAAGSGNLQANNFAAAVGNGEYFAAVATVSNKQKSDDNDSTYTGSLNKAEMGKNSINGNSGNVGVNAAAGDGNLQTNNLAAAVGNGVLQAAVATVYNNQMATYNTASYSSSNNNASLGAGSLSNNMGNIGVNIAAGSNNLQSNSLAVSAGNVSF
ncbi:hypothetical protein C7H85_17285 [Zobellella endophytica]|uniref:Uncharacterized protein n=1 Tax=Zobellella endophytica TaxID=2116700 RepID=A0A2P7QWN4_9GAMM|nr:hypothetical protein [Zobellella endophytica]PSJ42364.1 hypothetical protein C7H85_17285 [Zobellella endophytica]